MIYITLPPKNGVVAWRASVNRRQFDHTVPHQRRSAAGRSTPEILRRGQESNGPAHLTENWTSVCSGDASRSFAESAKRSLDNALAMMPELGSDLRNGQGMRNIVTALAAALLLLITLPVEADSSAQLNVSVRVIARAIVAVEGQPEVEITPLDVERGFVDVPSVQVRLRTNSLNGSMLQANKTSEAFSAVELAFGGTTMVIAPESWVRMPYVPGGEVLNVRMRARLAPGATAGRYPLPVQFSASTL